MKRKCMNKLMVGVLAVGMTLAGCFKSPEPPVETTPEGFESSADATEASNVTEPGTTQAAQVADPTTDPTTAPTTAPEEAKFDAFKTIAHQDTFADTKVIHDRLVKYETVKDEETGNIISRIRMMDKLGNDRLSYTLSSDDPFTCEYSTVTEDDGLLFVLCRSGSEGDAERRIIRLGSDGRVQFTAQLDGIAFDSIDHCFEVDGKYYLFGTCKRVNTGILDVCAIQIEADGRPRKTAKIGGEDDTKLILAEPSEEGFLVLVETRSSTGDFEEINLRGNLIDVAISMDKEFNTLEMTEKELQEATRKPIGEKAGKPVHSDDPFLQDYDLKDPTLFIDYGDYYLIRGKREIGRIYPKANDEVVLKTVYETVYTAYDMDGNVVFNEAVDPAIDPALELSDRSAEYVPGGLPARVHNSEAWYCNQFMSVGDPPFSIPAGAQLNKREWEDIYDCINVSRADYDAVIAGLKADGYQLHQADGADCLFRDDCLIFLKYYEEEGDAGFRTFWYRGNKFAPENGISAEEAADLLMTDLVKKQSFGFVPIDVTPDEFYERTGGQLFIMPNISRYDWYECDLYYVNGGSVYCSTLESIAVYDVDDDGKDEVLYLSYGPTYGFYTVTLYCLTGQDCLNTTFFDSGWAFDSDENGRLRIGGYSYLDIKEVMGEKTLLVYEEVIYETKDGEKTEYMQIVYAQDPNHRK